MRAASGRGGWLWLGVAYVFTDCIASIRWEPLAAADSGDGSGSSAASSSGGAGGATSGVAALVDRASLRFFRFQRGELVLLKSPEEPAKRVVRRLIGLEGDWVTVAAGGGGTTGGSALLARGGKVEKIPKGCCWVEADSAGEKAGGDSRVSWGAVPLALIEGRVSHVLWPPARWGTLGPQLAASGTRVVGKGGNLEFLTPPAEEDDWWA